MPVNYAAYQNANNPLQMAIQGYSDAGAIQQARQQQQIGTQTLELNRMKIDEYKKAQEKALEFQTANAKFAQKPKKTAQDFVNFQAQYPQVKGSYDGVIESMSSEQLRSRISQSLNIASAIEMKKPEIAKKLMQEYKLAAENSGDQQFSESIDVLGQLYDGNSGPEIVDAGLNNFLLSADPANFATMYNKIKSNADMPAETVAFENLMEGLSIEDRVKAKRIKLGLDARAQGSADYTLATGDPEKIELVAQVVATLAASKENAQLNERLKLEPKIKLAVDQASGLAKAIVEADEGRRDNGKALRAYEAGIGSLSTALGNTYTGVGGDLVAALTVEGQIANASIALMAPILKDIFRGAGEGTFTKDDQEILMAMLPTLNMRPGARAAALKAVDTVVRAKLSVPSVTDTTSGVDSSALPTIDTQAEYDALSLGDKYIDAQTGLEGTRL
tara:strand:+ start:224 stop:1561 length:1338 start_codon:yes stop_codon:yes gene_type:complete